MARPQKLLRTALIGLSLLTLSACAELTPREQRVLSGGSIGSAVGIGVTVLTGGCIPCGGSVGSVVGSGIGYLYDFQMGGQTAPKSDKPDNKSKREP
jgi:osmotically inducible lipoprotein OsmB